MLAFVAVPGVKTVKNRMHIDLAVTSGAEDNEVKRLIALGARRVDVGQGSVSWVVLADPEGNDFCAETPPRD